MFRGEYSHSIDSKGRLIIPAKYREALGDGFVLTKGLDGCLMAYDNAEWEAFEDKLKDLPSTNPSVRKLQRFFMGGASDVESDSQGRVVIPSTLRDHAGLKKDAVLIGMGNRIEIWSKEKYEAEATYEDMDEVVAALEAMGLSI